MITVVKLEKIFSHYLILAGNLYRSRESLSLQRGGVSVSGVSVTRYGGRIANDLFSRCHHAMHSQTDCPLEENVSKQKQTFHNNGEHSSLLSLKSSRCTNFKLKATRRIHSYLSSVPFRSSNAEQKEVCRLGLSKRKHPQPDVGKANKFRVWYKSEEYDISGTNMDRLQPTEGTGEAILLGGNSKQISWWQQLPKRWVIVLLCFTAFLLCNMDRVSNVFWCLWFQLR